MNMKRAASRLDRPVKIDTDARDGTQAIRRAIAVLKMVSSCGDLGLSLDEAASRMHMARSTAHRILKALVEENLVEQNELDHHYTVGPLAHELTLATTKNFYLSAGWSAAADVVARHVGYTSYLMARSGLETVCLYKADGRGALQVVPVDVGQRRPLGVGGGGIALLSGFEPATIREIVTTLGSALPGATTATPAEVIESALLAKRRGYAVSMGRVYAQVIGIGVAIPSMATQLSVSVAAPLSGLKEARIKEIAQVIREAIEQLRRRDRLRQNAMRA
jgi:DNA-binding IclR family transcriptional regulator